jgi:hypothetical protein
MILIELMMVGLRFRQYFNEYAPFGAFFVVGHQAIAYLRNLCRVFKDPTKRLFNLPHGQVKRAVAIQVQKRPS